MMLYNGTFPVVEEYPENVAERGVPQDMYYKCVSHTFLDGLINYTNPIKGYLHFKPSGSNADHYANDMYEIEQLLAIHNRTWHSKFKLFANSRLYIRVAVLSETETSYWMFLYDPDVSDCEIGRCSKERVTKEQFIEAMEGYMKLENYIENLERLSGWLGW